MEAKVLQYVSCAIITARQVETSVSCTVQNRRHMRRASKTIAHSFDHKLRQEQDSCLPAQTYAIIGYEMRPGGNQRAVVHGLSSLFPSCNRDQIGCTPHS